MNYSYIPEEYQQSFVSAPKPSHNGGLYGGAAFAPNAPWANIPVSPDVDTYIHQNLKSANPPPQATTQYPGNVRPGNNFQVMPGVDAYDSAFGNLQINVPEASSGTTCSYGGGKYAMWNGNAK